VTRNFKRGGQLKKLLAFAYISSMSCCDCRESKIAREIRPKSGDAAKSNEKKYDAHQDFDELFDDNALTSGFSRCI